MSRRLDFNKAFRNDQARYGVSVKDETEWTENDAAACWLEKKESGQVEKNGRSGRRQAKIRGGE
jgi:hypothetical protein